MRLTTVRHTRDTSWCVKKKKKQQIILSAKFLVASESSEKLECAPKFIFKLLQRGKKVACRMDTCSPFISLLLYFKWERERKTLRTIVELWIEPRLWIKDIHILRAMKFHCRGKWDKKDYSELHRHRPVFFFFFFLYLSIECIFDGQLKVCAVHISGYKKDLDLITERRACWGLSHEF